MPDVTERHIREEEWEKRLKTVNLHRSCKYNQLILISPQPKLISHAMSALAAEPEFEQVSTTIPYHHVTLLNHTHTTQALYEITSTLEPVCLPSSLLHTD